MGRCARLALLLATSLALGGCELLAPVAVDTPAPAEDSCADERARAEACVGELAAVRGARDALRESCAAWGDDLAALRAGLTGLEERLAREQPAPLPAPACDEGEAVPGEKLLIGRREEVWIEDLQLALPARIDTGAETASLDARNIREFERDGDQWVRFDLVHPASGEPLALERPVARVVRILQSSSQEAERRVVIELGIVLGHVRQLAEFTLSDRSHLDFQMLVGRNILKDLMIVDVGQSNIAPYRGPGSTRP
ncbi:ATP-dependent zinc protease family protein [Pseudohaliea rubra]|uniref:Retropepsin-like aspartic endopeptidase domain-containing protein n=1 Tax=Pseudohaliea rubra DSM 19751 TaxID=1265313 RepID=A0A095XX01_9GAMM|nr:RimK/LysX family protein [Pseudohaliea rubra]KGE04216.1 hypothetical protein HRUBRA_01193 [Pseudohaliea rubra DSM 19751]